MKTITKVCRDTFPPVGSEKYRRMNHIVEQHMRETGATLCTCPSNICARAVRDADPSLAAYLATKGDGEESASDMSKEHL